CYLGVQHHKKRTDAECAEKISRAGPASAPATTIVFAKPTLLLKAASHAAGSAAAWHSSLEKRKADVTGPELKKLREDLGEGIGRSLSIADMAKLCGLETRDAADTIRKWEVSGPSGPA